MLKNKLENFLVIALIFLLITGWFFSGWPQIWRNPSVPPKVQEVLAETETIRPTNYYDLELRTTNPSYAYNGITTNSGDTNYNSDEYFSISYGQDSTNNDTWGTKNQTWTAATLCATIEREVATNDTAGVNIETSAGVEKHILLSQSYTAFAKQEVCQVLNSADWGGSGFPDIYDLRVTVDTDKVGGPDNKLLKIYDIRIDGEYAANADPTVSAVNLTPSPIVLTENTTTTVTCIATIIDTDGGATISSATGTIYRSGVGSACSADNNNCYQIASCDLSAADNNNKYATCTADIWFHADPTDTGAAEFSGDTWQCEVTGTDSSAATGSGTDASPPELDTLNALIVTSSIDYGTLGQGATSSSSKLIVATTTGNASIDVNISGLQMDDNNGHTFSVSYQEYSLSEVDYGSGTDATSSATALVLASGKPTTNPSDESDIIYWRIGIPVGQELGTYYGTTTIAAKVKG